MTNNDELRYIQAYARIIGVKEDEATEYAQRKGLNALVENADQLLTTKAQREKYDAFLDLYRMSSSISSRNPVIKDPETAAAFFHSVMEKAHDRESFIVAFLNTRNRVIDYDVVSVGSINSSIIHPREVFRNAILNKANAILVCHNHPTGNLSPSQDDISATNKLTEAGRMLGIAVMDHIIITGINKDDAYSFKQNSLMEEREIYAADSVISEQVASYKTTKEKMKEITDKLEDGIRDIFESGKYQSYLQTMSKFHKYSFNNTILISMQRPDATLIASFNKWRDQFGRSVKKGERGIRIIAPAPYKMKQSVEKMDPRTNQAVRDSKGNILFEEKEISVPAFKVVSVFDASQTEGEPLPEIARPLEGSVNNYEVLLKALRGATTVPIDFADMKSDTDGLFNLEKRQITIRSGMSEIQTVLAVIHEIAHAKLHSKSQDVRSSNDLDYIMPDKRTKEVEAESVSFAVCSRLGIETGENSFGYIAAWSQDKQLSELKSSLERISSTASELIDDITWNLENLAKDQPATDKEQKSVGTANDRPKQIHAKQVPTALLDPMTSNGAYQIYQIKAEPNLKYHRFASMKKLAAMGHSVNMDNYACVYQGEVKPASQVIDDLNSIYEKFNADRPDDYTGYSLSVSDVIVIKSMEQVTAYFVDDFGFKEIPDFLEDANKARVSSQRLEEDDHTNNTQSKSPDHRSRAGEKASLKGQLKDASQKRSSVRQSDMSKDRYFDR